MSLLTTTYSDLTDAARVAASDDVRLSEAFQVCAERFRATGVFLVLTDSGGEVLLHDEGAEAKIYSEVVPALRKIGAGLVERVTTSVEVIAPEMSEGLLVAGFRPVCASNRVCLVVSVAELGGAVLGREMLVALAGAIRDTLADQLAARHAAGQLDGLTEQLADTYEELSLLDTVTAGMRVNRTPEDFYRGLCTDIRTVLATRCVGAVLRPGRMRGNSLIVQGDLELDPVRLSRFVDEMMELLVDGMSATPKPLIVNDVMKEEHFAFLSPGFRQLLAVPLMRDQHVLGFLFASDKATGKFDSVDAKLMASVASASAVYCENSLLYDDLHGLMMGLLHSLTSAIDAKDSYTCGHSDRVALLSRLLAKEAGFSDEEADRIYISGLLHDVGKIGVSEAVLRKSGKLTAEEFEEMKAHPQIGARILEGVAQVQDIIPGVLHHHERYDGRGYPYNLAGKDIPVMGRILCLADSFDAMTSNRTYRRGMPLQQALDEIQRCAGAQFDPELAQVFVGLGADRLALELDAQRVRRPAAAMKMAWAA